MDNFTKPDKLEFGQIILGHIKQILLLSRTRGKITEFRNGVIVLGDSLSSYFDTEMLKAEEHFDNIQNKNNRDYRIYFRELLALVKRVDYFKNAVYGEASDDIIEDEVDRE